MPTDDFNVNIPPAPTQSKESAKEQLHGRDFIYMQRSMAAPDGLTLFGDIEKVPTRVGAPEANQEIIQKLNQGYRQVDEPKREVTK
jgi:hypothetical protein